MNELLAALLAVAGGLYRPRDYDAQFHGLVSARTALASSLNVPAVRTLGLVGGDGRLVSRVDWIHRGRGAGADRKRPFQAKLRGTAGVVRAIATLSGEPGGGAATVAGMSEDAALASGVATMMLRDLPQPLTATRTGWADRAAVFEDRWIESGGVFGSPADPLVK